MFLPVLFRVSSNLALTTPRLVSRMSSRMVKEKGAIFADCSWEVSKRVNLRVREGDAVQVYICTSKAKAQRRDARKVAILLCRSAGGGCGFG